MATKILVTGGSGFIGTRLVARLVDAGNRVSILDRVMSDAFPDRTTIGDVRDAEALSAACKGVEIIYNLAAEHRDDVTPQSLYYDVNVGGARNICAAAEDHGVKLIIFTSSVAVYGTGEAELDEASHINPLNEYGRTKWLAEEVQRQWLAAGPGRALIVVRPTAIFGPGNRGNVYNLINQIRRKSFVMVGAGKNRKSIGYVENVADFLVHVLTFQGGEHVYNYADKPDLDMNELTELVRSGLGRKESALPHLPYGLAVLAGNCFDLFAVATGRKLPISRARVEKFCANTRISSKKALNSGFQPRHRLKDALRATIEAEFGNEAR